MKHTSLVLLSMLCASAPLFADQDQRIIPAGSLISCTIAEPKISSKTTAIGDPVLCQLSHSEHYGRSVLPYKSYLVGRFEDYKDPGHFVGKGWMQLKFDRMVVEPDTVIPVDARVVDVPGYHVDNQGRILGKGHEKRDIALWSIPVLWPVDLLMLPMRGPRPTLKEETHLTLKVMDDLAVPVTTGPQTDPYGLQHRQPIAQDDPPPLPEEEPAPETAYAAPQQPPPPQDDSQSQDYNYAPQVAPPPPVYAYGYTAPLPVYGYGYGGYAPYGAGFRAYGYGGSRYYGYRGYAGAPRGPRVGGYGYGGPSRGYGGASRGFAGGYGGGRPGGAVMSTRGGGGGYAGGGFRGGGGGGGGHRR